MKAAISVFLVGMMGAGKSTVGVRLARRLGREFIDADRELEARLGVSIPTIFELEGEAGFRRRETQLLEELCTRPGLVLATGGGVVLAPHNRELLKAHGRVVYLQAQPGDLWQRLRRDRQRPLLRTPNPRERIHNLCAERDPIYLSVAHHIITTGRQPIDQIVDAVVTVLDGEPSTEPVAVAAPRRPGQTGAASVPSSAVSLAEKSATAPAGAVPAASPAPAASSASSVPASPVPAAAQTPVGAPAVARTAADSASVAPSSQGSRS